MYGWAEMGHAILDVRHKQPVLKVKDIEKDIWWEENVMHVRDENGDIHKFNSPYPVSISYGDLEHDFNTLIGNSRKWGN
jgi:hypothetical protein